MESLESLLLSSDSITRHSSQLLVTTTTLTETEEKAFMKDSLKQEAKENTNEFLSERYCNDIAGVPFTLSQNFNSKKQQQKEAQKKWQRKRNAFTPAGVPDVLSCYKGRFLGIEVKGGSSYGLTELQKYNLRLIRQAGGIGVCVYPSGWQQFLDVLDRLDAGEQVEITDENYILK